MDVIEMQKDGAGRVMVPESQRKLYESRGFRLVEVALPAVESVEDDQDQETSLFGKKKKKK